MPKTIRIVHALYRSIPARAAVALGTVVSTHCIFHPTCSEYAVESIAASGLFRGGARALWRVLRCNPFSHGGVDLPK